MSNIYDPTCAIHGTPIRDGCCPFCTTAASGAVPIPFRAPVPAAPAPSEPYYRALHREDCAWRNAVGGVKPPCNCGELEEADDQKRKPWTGAWNNWIAPFHFCPRCGESLAWSQAEDALELPYVRASCCGVGFIARMMWHPAGSV